MKSKTKAEIFSDRMGCGDSWETADGLEFHDLMDEMGVIISYSRSEGSGDDITYFDTWSGGRKPGDPIRYE